MRVRGLTLLETLLALALLVMVLSLVGPALLLRIAPMTFERTAGQFESALLLAREDARRTGAPRYIYAEPGEPGGGTRLLARRTPRGDSAETGGGVNGAGVELAAFAPDEPGDVLLVLPSGIGIVHERAGAAAGLFDDRGGEVTGGERLILVCLPDGSVLRPRPAWLIDDDGRSAELRVRPALGQISLGPVERVGSGAGADALASPDRGRAAVRGVAP